MPLELFENGGLVNAELSSYGVRGPMPFDVFTS